MASKTSSIAALFLALNLLLFSSVSGQYFASNPSQILTCPPNTVKLDVCLSVLNGLLGVVVGNPGPCCSLLAGLVNLDANVCLCTALKLNVLGIVNLNVPLCLDALLSTCNIPKPTGFICA